MKMKKTNKIVSDIMLFLILFSVIQPVFAASGSGTWSGGQYASGMKTTDNASGTTGVLIRRLNNLNTGEKRTVFCAEHGIDFKIGASYNGVYYTPTNSNIRKACKVAYLGWYKNNGGYTIDGGILASDMKWVKWDYVFTQQYIWKILGQSNATFIKADEQQGYIDFKNKINNEITNIEKRPSFNGSTITIQAGETKTIPDSNGVLAEYGTIDNAKDGIRFVHQNGSNSMTILVDENTNLENYRISDNTFKEWGMIKNGTEDNDTMVYFEFASGVQNQLYCMSYNDPVTLNFSLAIETFGRLELQKLNTNGDLVNGAVFKVRVPNDYNKDNIKSRIKQKKAKDLKNVIEKSNKTIKSSTKQAIKTSKRATSLTKKSIKTTEQVAKNSKKVAKETIKMSQRAARVTKRMVQVIIKGIKVALKATIATIKSIIAATKALISAIAAGGWVAVVMILVIVLIAGFVAAIFNSEGDADYDSSQIPNSQIVLVAKAQIGNEGGDKFWKWYGFEEYVHWCACYVSWCANECGYIDKGIIPKFAVCTDGITWFKEINGTIEEKAITLLLEI